MSVLIQQFLTRITFFSLFLFLCLSRVDASVLDPQADMYRSQGLAEQDRGHYKNALSFFLKAAGMAEESPLLYNDIGINYEQLGYTQRAEQYYLRALKIDNNYLPSYSNLAFLYESIGEIDKAIQFFQERLRRAAVNDPWKEKIVAELMRIDPQYKENAIREDLEETAEKLAREAEEKEREDFTLSVERADTHYRRAENFISQGLYEMAVDEYDQALKLTPENPKILKARDRAVYSERIDEVKHRIAVATEQLSTGNVDSAKDEFQQILAIIPNEPIQDN